jgi:hypothetical protein
VIEAFATSENLKGNIILEYSSEAVKIILKWVLKEYGVKMFTRFDLLRRETSGGML